MEQNDVPASLAKPKSTLPTQQKTEKKESFIFETLRFAFFAALIVLPIRYFVAQPFIVSGDSMVPTFQNGEYLIVDELTYRFEIPKRGDVIIFRYPLEPRKFFIKRIVGLPGETLQIDGNKITVTNPVTKQSVVLDEPYIQSIRDDHVEVTLSSDQYYVLGDNRAESSDSRIWGPLPRKNIIGRPIVRLLPFSHIGILPGAKTQ